MACVGATKLRTTKDENFVLEALMRSEKNTLSKEVWEALGRLDVLQPAATRSTLKQQLRVAVGLPARPIHVDVV